MTSKNSSFLFSLTFVVMGDNLCLSAIHTNYRLVFSSVVGGGINHAFTMVQD